MNTTAAATEAHVTVATIRTWCRRGVIAAAKKAGCWIIDTASLARRIATGARRHANPAETHFTLLKEHAMPSTSIPQALVARLHAAAAYLAEAGWTECTERDDAGRIGVEEAIRLCGPRSGDGHLLNVLLYQRGMGYWDTEEDKGVTQDEVVELLATTEITTADLEATFGPRWEAVVAMVRQVAALTNAQAQKIHTAWDAGPAAWAGEVAARVAGVPVRFAPRAHGGTWAAWTKNQLAADDPRLAATWVTWACRAAGDAARDAAGSIAVDAVQAVAAAEAACGLIADVDYHRLTAPWRTVIPA
ncbi:hypothetical protein ACVW0K_007292 [Streptomyces filamentosus]